MISDDRMRTIRTAALNALAGTYINGIDKAHQAADAVARAVSESTQPSASPSPPVDDVKVMSCAADNPPSAEGLRDGQKKPAFDDAPKYLAAYTAPGCDYPEYISIYRTYGGMVQITVRSPRGADGSRGVTATMSLNHWHFASIYKEAEEKLRARAVTIPNATEAFAASSGTKEQDITLTKESPRLPAAQDSTSKGCSRCGSPESEHGKDYISVCKGFVGPGGWIPWEGGECPVAKDTRVEVLIREGIKQDRYQAGDWSWVHHGTDGDIVAYRVLSSPPAAKEETDPLDEKVTYRGLIEALRREAQAHLTHSIPHCNLLESLAETLQRTARGAK